MDPTLFQVRLGGLSLGLSTYGAFLALGFVAALAVVVLGGARLGLGPRVCVRAAGWAAVAGLIGAWLGALIVPGSAHRSPAPLSFLPGLAAAALGVGLYARMATRPAAALLALLAPAVAAAKTVSALGCLAAGCCFGVPAAPGEPAVRFAPGTVAFSTLAEHGVIPLGAPTTPALLPVQLLEAMLWVIAAAAIWRLRPSAAGAGLLVALGVIPMVVAPLRAGGSALAWSSGMCLVLGVCAIIQAYGQGRLPTAARALPGPRRL
jgi:phosphatidylglycerol:prolipoprotein diacylglycerol transferase